MTFVSYAQNFEDVVLWRALHDVKNGRYLDIGAHDPVVDSVSLAFYEAGWRGIHAEATPFYASRLREARPEEIVVEAAVTDDPGPIEFYEIPDTGLSTGRADIAEHHADSGRETRKIHVPCVRLDRLLDMATGDLHWLKIDVEGMEVDVLRSWGESAQRPWVLVVEGTYPGTQEPTDQLWIDEALTRGYRQVLFDGLSRYFLHESRSDLADRFAAPANVFDRFLVTGHHFSAAEIRQELEVSQGNLSDERLRADELSAELREAQRTLHAARREHNLALDGLASATRDHEAAMNAALRERLDVERGYREREDDLRRELRVAEVARAAAQTEVARLEERSSQLQGKFDHSDARLAAAEERLAGFAATAERVRADADLRIADALASMDRIRHERDEARAQAGQARQEIARIRADRGGELERVTLRLAEANDLIRAVAAHPRGAWQRIGEAIGLARRPAALLALAAWPAAPAHHRTNEPAANHLAGGQTGFTMQSFAPFQSRNPYLRANSLSELLSWHDVDFVRCAYVTILGRQPDPSGETYYAERIRRGHSKMEVLRQLRRSSEGRLHDPGIAGLDRALKEAALGRTPVIGALVRLFIASEPDGRGIRRWRSLANSIETLRTQQQSHLARLGAQVETLAAARSGEIAPDTSTNRNTQVDRPGPAAPPAVLSARAKDIFAAMASVR